VQSVLPIVNMLYNPVSFYIHARRRALRRAHQGYVRVLAKLETFLIYVCRYFCMPKPNDSA
jgi:hypothetical protein